MSEFSVTWSSNNNKTATAKKKGIALKRKTASTKVADVAIPSANGTEAVTVKAPRNKNDTSERNKKLFKREPFETQKTSRTATSKKKGITLKRKTASTKGADVAIPSANGTEAVTVKAPTNKNDTSERNKKFKRKPFETQKTSRTSLIRFKRVAPLVSLTPSLIKRKKKKEKVAARLAAQQGTNPSTDEEANEPLSFATPSPEHKAFVKPVRTGSAVIEKVFSADKTFKSLNIHRHIVSNLEKIGFTKLTNVQEKSIPVALTGKNVLVRSQTGSGKTLAYAVPILNALQGIHPKLQRGDGVQALIIVPTRELVMQTHEIFCKINTFQWLIVGYLCGGENRNSEKSRLRKGVHILIATPGRLLDHLLHTTSFKSDNIRCLVLDEADRLLDMGFHRDIVSIVQELDKSKANNEYNPMALIKGKKTKFDEPTEQEVQTDTMPLSDVSSKSRQTMLLSATLSKAVAELADFTMKDHIYIDALEENSDLGADLLVIPNTVKQKYVVVPVKQRLSILSAMLIVQAEKSSKVFVFMGTSTMVDFHYELFTKHLVRMRKSRGQLKSGDVLLLEGVEGMDSDEEEEVVLDVDFFKLHGNMEQSARKEVFTKFRAAKTGVLICTDVVARGVDVPTADCIIQYNGPQSVEDYLHRVGRTGRAGNSGISYIFLSHEERDFVTELERHRVYVDEEDQEGFSNQLSVFMGEPDAYKAGLALRRHYEQRVSEDKELHKLACLAYSSWSRFYNTYSKKVRSIFDFKKVNLGHYLSSFAVKETPTEAARIVKGQVAKLEPQRLNKKLAIHGDELRQKSFSLTVSEFSSGLEPKKKKLKTAK